MSCLPRPARRKPSRFRAPGRRAASDSSPGLIPTPRPDTASRAPAAPAPWEAPARGSSCRASAPAAGWGQPSLPPPQRLAAAPRHPEQEARGAGSRLLTPPRHGREHGVATEVRRPRRRGGGGSCFGGGARPLPWNGSAHGRWHGPSGRGRSPPRGAARRLGPAAAAAAAGRESPRGLRVPRLVALSQQAPVAGPVFPPMQSGLLSPACLSPCALPLPLPTRPVYTPCCRSELSPAPACTARSWRALTPGGSGVSSSAARAVLSTLPHRL